LKKTVIDVDKICKHGKEHGITYKQMYSCLEISKQRLHQLRNGNKIETMEFIKLCELCEVEISDWKSYIKEVEINKE